MHILEFLKNLFRTETIAQVSEITSTPCTVAAKKLSYAEKELIAVKRTTIQDLQQLYNFPFSWNARLEKYTEPNGHPFAFMDIVGSNTSAALSELEKINVYISQSKLLCNKVPKDLQIPTKDIIFKRSNDKGYSRLICSPVSYSGERTEIPITLSFMTDLDRRDTTHGDLCYGQDGSIQKATIYFWRKGTGHFFYYEKVLGNLVLSKIEHTNLRNEKTILYKGQHILELEAQKAQEEDDYAWLQVNLADQCPKSISSYRRMKTQNTKNYQTLQQLAANLGRDI